VIILLFAAAISLSVGEITNAIIIVIIVFASVTLNFFQEYKAENAAELLKQKLVSKAVVFRDGTRISLPVTDLVPGDVILIVAGDIVPADATLFQTAWFMESICTQTPVVFVIRTRVVPFYTSRPGRLLTFSTILIVAIAFILPFTVIGSIFGFIRPPLSFFTVLAGLVAGYIVMVELVKHWFYRKYSGFIERNTVPPVCP
jgi:magnesium-transporting ATPase (P-type)